MTLGGWGAVVAAAIVVPMVLTTLGERLARRVDTLVQRGHARRLDHIAGVWRYTARGAMQMALGGHATAWRRALKREVAQPGRWVR